MLSDSVDWRKMESEEKKMAVARGGGNLCAVLTICSYLKALNSPQFQ